MKKDNVLPHDWFPRPMPTTVDLGERTWCYSAFSCLHYHSRHRCGVRVGHDSGIYHSSFFELGPDGEVDIGNFCTLVGVIIATNSRILIEDYAFLAHEVVLADSFAAIPWQDGAAQEPSTGVSRPPVITVGANSWIGARAVLLAGAHIGEGAVVGTVPGAPTAVPPQPSGD